MCKYPLLSSLHLEKKNLMPHHFSFAAKVGLQKSELVEKGTASKMDFHDKLTIQKILCTSFKIVQFFIIQGKNE